MSVTVIIGTRISGKTTWAQKLCRENDKNWLIVCGIKEEHDLWSKAGFDAKLAENELLSTLATNERGIVFDTNSLPSLAIRALLKPQTPIIFICQPYAVPEYITNACKTWYLFRMGKTAIDTVQRVLAVRNPNSPAIKPAFDQLREHRQGFEPVLLQL